jgi:hypothetical protein
LSGRKSARAHIEEFIERYYIQKRLHKGHDFAKCKQVIEGLFGFCNKHAFSKDLKLHVLNCQKGHCCFCFPPEATPMFRKRVALLIGFLCTGVALAQNVVVNPTSTQDIVQPPATQLQTNNFDGVRYYDASWNWSNAPGGTLTGGTQATITLTNCPRGIDTSGQGTYLIYISGGSGTAEVTQVTGGTCATGGTNETVIFTPANSHSGAFTIGSASSGIQEMIVDGCAVTSASPTVNNVNAHLVLPATGPGNSNPLLVHGSIFVHCGKALLEGDGTLLSCSTRDRCMVLGDLMNSNHYGNVTVRGIRFESAVSQDGCQIVSTRRTSNFVTITVASGCTTIQNGDTVVINFVDNTSLAYWGVQGGTQGVTVSGTAITYASAGANIASQTTPGTIAIENAAVEDNALPGTMDKLEISGAGSGSFNEGLVIDNDQAATIRNLNYTAGGLLCDGTHCGSAIYSAGNTGAAPVIWVDKANLSMQCAGNGITVLANNTVHVTDSVIQGFGMWGVNTQTILGSFGGTQLDNVYNEEGSGPCPNPYEGSNFSAVGIIFSGGQPLIVRGGEQPNGLMPEFSNTGSTQYNYYIVAHDSGLGASYPLFAGYALTNGSGTINGQFPHIAPASPGDTVTYDILRMQPSSGLTNAVSFPPKGACTGGSATACGSIITGQAQCSGLVCTFLDTASASTSSYSIAQAQWFPMLSFWPGGVVLAGGGTSNAGNTSPAFLDSDSGSSNTSAWISVAGNLQPSFYVRQCLGNASSFYGGAWTQCLEGFSHGNSFGVVGALLLNNGTNSGGSGLESNIKGRLNFEVSPYADLAVQHLITLVDSNPAKTLATPLSRPPNDANDSYIGIDQTSGLQNTVGLSFGAPVSISAYIGNGGDNSSFKERLTASSKTFSVPLTLNSTVTTYNGLSTSGLGVPPIIGTPLNSTGNTANLSPTTLYSTAATGAGSAGTYRVCLTAYVTATGTATAIGPVVLYNNGNSVARNLPTFSAASTSNVSDACVTLYSTASQTIRVETLGYSGTGTFAVRATIEQLQ